MWPGSTGNGYHTEYWMKATFRGSALPRVHGGPSCSIVPTLSESLDTAHERSASSSSLQSWWKFSELEVAHREGGSDGHASTLPTLRPRAPPAPNPPLSYFTSFSGTPVPAMSGGCLVNSALLPNPNYRCVLHTFLMGTILKLGHNFPSTVPVMPGPSKW